MVIADAAGYLQPSQQRQRQLSVPKAAVIALSISRMLQAAWTFCFPVMQRTVKPWQLSAKRLYDRRLPHSLMALLAMAQLERGLFRPVAA